MNTPVARPLRTVSMSVVRSAARVAVASVVVAGLLSACSTEGENEPTRPAASAALVGAGSAPESSAPPRVLTVPSGFPEVLPIPKGAEIQSASGACRVTWLVSGAELDAVAAEVSSASTKADLEVKHQSSHVPGPPEVSIDPWGVETVVPGPVEVMASLTLIGGGVDASLALTTPAPGVVFGEYSVRVPACAG